MELLVIFVVRVCGRVGGGFFNRRDDNGTGFFIFSGWHGETINLRLNERRFGFFPLVIRNGVDVEVPKTRGSTRPSAGKKSVNY